MTNDVRQVIERLETIASHQGCHGPFDENCYEYPERVSEWCAPCVMGAAYKALAALAQPAPSGSALPIADPITAAVDAQLDPLKRELVDIGHTLARDEDLVQERDR